jgi:malate synthase
VPGPQLVVPITNARFALNAANARWGSLYDALYGTDAMGAPAPAGPGYDRGRGARVVARARVFLDEAFPIAGASHADIRRYRVEKGQLLADDKPLMNPEKFVGYTGHPRGPDTAVLLRNNGLHVELVFDRTHPIGARDQAGWPMCGWRRRSQRDHGLRGFGRLRRCRGQGAGLWQLAGPDAGGPAESFEKGGETVTRILKGDRAYTAPDGARFTVKGRALMLVRNVGHLMTNPAILLTATARRPSRG